MEFVDCDAFSLANGQNAENEDGSTNLNQQNGLATDLHDFRDRQSDSCMQVRHAQAVCTAAAKEGLAVRSSGGGC